VTPRFFHNSESVGRTAPALGRFSFLFMGLFQLLIFLNGMALMRRQVPSLTRPGGVVA
jgi:hypothetical protein